jgi:imidazolonepropionase-like amidohydrolase
MPPWWPAALDLMVQKGTYLGSHNHLLLHNYLDYRENYIGFGNWNEEGFAYMEKALPVGNDTFKRAMAKKVKIVFGTDATASAIGRNQEEMVYRVKEGGMAPMAAIVSATSLAAESLRMDKTIGIIAPGMEADLIATEGNPATDITAVRNVVFVMKGGKIYKNIVKKSS